LTSKDKSGLLDMQVLYPWHIPGSNKWANHWRS